jgi:uncharacterized Zn finger protein
MARQTKDQSAPSSNDACSSPWAVLTWDDLDRWAGSRSFERGRSYQRGGRVRNLAIMDDGRLLADVQGTERYVTSVSLVSAGKRRTQLTSQCSCPVGVEGCKHAVAVVAEYLAMLADGRRPAKTDEDDTRWFRLTGEGDPIDDWDEDDSDDWEGDDIASRRPANSAGRDAATGRPSRKRHSRADWDAKLKSHLEQKSREQLAEFAWSMVQRFPEVRRELQERIELGEGDADQLLAQARRELRRCTAEPGWRNGWNGEGHTPDYGPLKRRLQRMCELGHADAVVALGRELIDAGMEQVGSSNDEGETAVALGNCLQVVFQAVEKSTLSAPNKLLYVIDAYLKEDYDILGSAAKKLLDFPWTTQDWSAVADVLAARLKQAPTAKNRNEDFSAAYARDRLSQWLINALEHAKRDNEVLAVMEREAHLTGSYHRLVAYLIEQRRYEDAERWGREGIQQTHQQYPGASSALAKLLCDAARKRKQWDVVAGHAAAEFFARPSATGLDELVRDATKAKCGPAVHAAAMQFLETGVLPIAASSHQGTSKAKGKPKAKAPASGAFPLPIPDYLTPMLTKGDRFSSGPRPRFDVLLDLAIKNKQPAEALRWYDRMNEPQKRRADAWSAWNHPASFAERVAQAVAAVFPDRALDIYRQRLDGILPQTGTTAYEQCGEYLKTMRAIMKTLHQEDHWDELVADIRHKYGNRPRFMEVLDKLQKRPIMEPQKTRRRK